MSTPQTMIRVGDLTPSIDFCAQVTVIALLRQADRPGDRFTNVVVGCDEESKNAALDSRTTGTSGVTAPAPAAATPRSRCTAPAALAWK